jgi:tRNA(fMet)-specific endonuclease VapC
LPFLLDTNACIALIDGRPPAVRANLETAVAAGEAILVSSIAVFELWYGVGKSARREFNTGRLDSFFSGPIEIIAFDDGDAETAGLLRATLETKGQPIGAYDLLIAGQAMKRAMTLVTANQREFARVPGLKAVDWSKL